MVDYRKLEGQITMRPTKWSSVEANPVNGKPYRVYMRFFGNVGAEIWKLDRNQGYGMLLRLHERDGTITTIYTTKVSNLSEAKKVAVNAVRQLATGDDNGRF